MASVDSHFACIEAVINQLPAPRMNTARVVAWWGTLSISLFVSYWPICDNCVSCSAGRDRQCFDVALQDGSHDSIGLFKDSSVLKISDDLRLGRTYVLLREATPGSCDSPFKDQGFSTT